MAPVPYDHSAAGEHTLIASPSALQPGMGSPPATAPPARQPQQQQHQTFLAQWQASIQPRLIRLLSLLGARDVAKSLALAQIITYLPVLTEGKQLLKAEALCLLGDPALQSFHVACASEGLPLSALGPMGKVWESGVVQVVQHAGNLPEDAHPMNRLACAAAGGAAAAAALLDEVVYLPVYDAAPGTPAGGVVAVLELMVSPRATDAMVVANLISTASEMMGELGLALSNPMAAAQAAAASKASMERKSAPPGVGMRQGSSYDANNAGMGAGSFGSGGGLSRTPSMRVLGTSLH